MRRHLNYGNGVVALEEEDEGAEPVGSAAQLAERLRARFAAPGHGLPMLPTVAIEALRLSAQPNVHLAELTALIERDLGLAAQVLRLARSPLHTGLVPVVSLSAAIVRLGLAAMRDVVLEAAMTMRVFKAAAYAETMERVRCHSVAVAHFARVVARFTSIDAEHAFICGLVHDAGFAAALIVLGEAPAAQRPALTPQTWSAIDALHEDLGETLVGLWKMPAGVDLIVRHHHSLGIGGHDHPMLAILAIAEALADREGLGLELPSREAALPLFSRERAPPDRMHAAIEQLRLSPPMLQAMNAAVARVGPGLERPAGTPPRTNPLEPKPRNG